tara:strand:- start:90 stop:545 length:456 start_codon:yes stop_codon:yes gene_type:complete
MEYNLAVSRIYEQADFNPACFNFTEEIARARKLWRDERPMPTQEQLEEALNSPSKVELLEELYNTMVKDVYAEMKVVFGTDNDASAQAFAATYEAMLKRPASYVDINLGLDDEAAVLAYAQTKIALSDAYGVFRLKRIGQYQAEKAAIEQA